MYTIRNTVEDKLVFSGSEKEMVEFVRKIVIENEDTDYRVSGVVDAVTYIDNFCGNLEWDD